MRTVGTRAVLAGVASEVASGVAVSVAGGTLARALGGGLADRADRAEQCPPADEQECHHR
ncbi:hypothetical protein GCM10020001_048970 [Nonomuraea salmonea]